MTNFDEVVLTDVYFQMFHFEDDVIYDPRHGSLTNPQSMMDGYSQNSEKLVSSSSVESNSDIDKQSSPSSLLTINSSCLRTNDNLATMELEDTQTDVIFPDSSSNLVSDSFSNVSIDIIPSTNNSQKCPEIVSIGRNHLDQQESLQQQANKRKKFVPITISNQIATIIPEVNLTTPGNHVTEIDLTIDNALEGETRQEENNTSEMVIQQKNVQQPFILNESKGRRKFHIIKVDNLGESFPIQPTTVHSKNFSDQMSSNLTIIHPHTYIKSNLINHNSIALPTSELKPKKLPASKEKLRKHYLRKDILKSYKKSEQNSVLKSDNPIVNIPKSNHRFKTRFQPLKDLLEAIITSEKRYFNLGLHNGPLAPSVQKKLTQLGTEAAKLARTTAVRPDDNYPKFVTYFAGKRV